MEPNQISVDALREQRARLKDKYRSLYKAISDLLFRHDPIGINFEANTDEYEPEAGTILPKLRSCETAEDVLEVVYGEFSHWFGEDVGEKECYRKLAVEIWDVWRRSQN